MPTHAQAVLAPTTLFSQSVTMGSGASVLCGGRPRLQLYCIDIRMAWCNGLVVYEDGTVRSIDNNEDEDMLHLKQLIATKWNSYQTQMLTTTITKCQIQKPKQKP